jgi:hypothetical protein
MNLAGETEVLGGNLPRRHFVHHKIPHGVAWTYTFETSDRFRETKANEHWSTYAFFHIFRCVPSADDCTLNAGLHETACCIPLQ